MAKTLGAAIVLLFSSRRGEDLLLPASTHKKTNDRRQKPPRRSASPVRCTRLHATGQHRKIPGGTVVCQKASGDIDRVRGRSLLEHCGYNHISPRFFRAVRGSTRQVVARAPPETAVAAPAAIIAPAAVGRTVRPARGGARTTYGRPWSRHSERSATGRSREKSNTNHPALQRG